MSDYKIAEQLVGLRILLQNICDGFDTDTLTKNNNLTMRLKVLYEIKNNEPCSPKILINNLGIAKGNLALLCKTLLKDQVILISKFDDDKRNIYYTITSKGCAELDNFYKSILCQLDMKSKVTNAEGIEKKLDYITTFLDKKYNKK